MESLVTTIFTRNEDSKNHKDKSTYERKFRRGNIQLMQKEKFSIVSNVIRYCTAFSSARSTNQKQTTT